MCLHSSLKQFGDLSLRRVNGILQEPATGKARGRASLDYAPLFLIPQLQGELLPAGIPLQLFALMWSRADVIGLLSNNVVSFSRNVVLGELLFSINVVGKRAMLSVRTVYVLSFATATGCPA